MKNNIRKIVIAFILSLTVISLEAQISQNKEFEKILKKIKLQEYLFDSYELNRESIRLANRLYKTATEDELIELANIKCKLCFCYSFWVLSKKNSQLTHELYEKYYKTHNDQNLIQINSFKKNRSCVKVILSEGNFITEIYKENKYLNAIK